MARTRAKRGDTADGLGTGNTRGPGSPHQCPRHREVPGNTSIAFAIIAEKELQDGQREDA